jgi:NADH dehydrogenase
MIHRRLGGSVKRICVLGGGIAGWEAARRLRAGLTRRRHLEVVLIDAQERATWTPLLYDVATGAAGARAAALPLRSLTEDSDGLRFLQARIEGLDLRKREVHTSGAAVDFDYLILAVGAEVNDHGFDVFRGGALPLKRAQDAAAIARRVMDAARAAEERGAPREGELHFVIVGGGPVGVELAAELASAARAELLPRLGPEARLAFQVTLVEGAAALVPRRSEALQRCAADALARLGVQVVLSDRVVGFDGREVALESGAALRADHLLWAAGVRAPAWLRDAGLEVDEDGLVRVAQDLEVLGQEEIFAVGDCANGTHGFRWPMTLHRAARQGELAAENILQDLVGASRARFDALHLGDFLRLGRFEAALDLGRGEPIVGRAAWIAQQLYLLSSAPGLSHSAAVLGERLNNLLQGGDWAKLPMSL